MKHLVIIMPIDIFESGFRMPETVYVLASGPKGVEHYHEIPQDAFVITVNKGIEIPKVNKAIWLCSDGTLPRKDWFNKAATRLIAANHDLDDRLNPTPVFDSGVLLAKYPNVPYSFKHGGNLIKNPIGFEYGVLKGGATVSSQAIQLAFLLGAKHIRLCGVDMSGDKYFDGTDTYNGQTRLSDTWYSIAIFNVLLQLLKNEKCTVDSISPTALKFEV